MSWHLHIQEDDVWPKLCGQVDPLSAILARCYLMTFVLEHLDEGVPDALLIVDDEQAGHQADASLVLASTE